MEGQANAGQPAQGGDGAAEKRFAALEAQISGQTKQIETITGLFQQMLGHQQQSQQQQQQQQTTPGPKGLDAMDDEALATLVDDPRKFAGAIQESMGAKFEEALKPLMERLGQMGTNIANLQGSGQIKEVAGKYPDFEAWRPEMAKLAEDTGMTNVDHIYTLAKALNPSKAKELEDKAAKEKADAQPDPARELLSFVPQKPGASNGAPVYGELNPEEAIQAAVRQHATALEGARAEEMRLGRIERD